MESHKWINKRNPRILLLPVLEAVALSTDEGAWEECWNGINDKTSWGYFELSSDDWTEVVEVSSDEWTISSDERTISSDERTWDVKVTSDDCYNVVDVTSDSL